MKRLLKILIVISIALTLPKAVFSVAEINAASSFTLKPTDNEVKVGSTFSLEYQISAANVRSGMIAFEVSDSLQIVSGTWKMSGLPISDFTGTEGVFLFEAPSAVSGDYFVLTLKAKTIDANAYVNASTRLQNGTAVIAQLSCNKNLAVICASHSYGSWVTTIEPKCETPGERQRSCRNCSHKEIESIAAIGHDYRYSRFEWSGYTAKAVYVCSHDSSHVRKYDAAITSKVTKEPTCTATGTKVYTAAYDGHTSTKNETLPALGHLFTHYVSNNDADFDHDGTKTATCDRGCGTKDTVTDAGSMLVAKSIEMLSLPKKTEYQLNEPIDLSGAKIRVTTTTGKTVDMDVAKAMISGFDSSKQGTCTVTVTFKGKKTTFKVSIVSYMRGDFNNDKKVTDADAIYLLMNTFFADEYPLNQPGDFNNDRKLTDGDAVYLLMYTFFPDEYPLN